MSMYQYIQYEHVSIYTISCNKLIEQDLRHTFLLADDLLQQTGSIVKLIIFHLEIKILSKI